MPDLHVTLIQSDISWEDPAENLEHFGKLINEIPMPTDLVILPEMFNTGFSMNPDKCAESMDGPTMAFLRDKAAGNDFMIAGSVLIEERGLFFNRLIFMQPDGIFFQYDKRHLFRLGNEHKVMTSGTEKTIIQQKGWNLLPLVCYDLRFPVWCRNTWKDGAFGYDVLVFVANWPGTRLSNWRSLLVSRAIDNQCYVIGVNRIGKDGYGNSHPGHSMIINPDGTVLNSAEEAEPAILQSFLSMEGLRDFRNSYPFAPDWDRFTIHL